MPDINKFRVLVHGCPSLAYGKAEGSALVGLSLLVDLPPGAEQVVSGYLGLCLCGVLLMLRKAEGSALAGQSLLVYLPPGAGAGTGGGDLEVANSLNHPVWMRIEGGR